MPLKWDQHFCYDHSGSAGSAGTRTATYRRALIPHVNALRSSVGALPMTPAEEDALTGIPFYSLTKELADLAARSAGTAVLSSLGTTRGGRHLHLLTVGNGPPETTPRVLFTGGLHAREWIGPDFVYLLAEWLVDSAAAGVVEAQELLATRTIDFVPMVNPDGHEYSVTTDRAWRKANPEGDPDFRTGPLASPTGPVSGAGESVDVNRNFETYHWASIVNWGGAEAPGSFSRDPDADDFVGTTVENSTEAQMIRSLLNNNSYALSVDVHSYGCYVMHSPSDDHTPLATFDPAAGPRATAFVHELAVELDHKAGGLSSIGSRAEDWHPSQGALMYRDLVNHLRTDLGLTGIRPLTDEESRTPGSIDDAMFYTHAAGANRGVAITLELPPMEDLTFMSAGAGMGSGFDLAAGKIEDVFRMCLSSCLAMIKHCDTPTINSTAMQQYRHLP